MTNRSPFLFALILAGAACTTNSSGEPDFGGASSGGPGTGGDGSDGGDDGDGGQDGGSGGDDGEGSDGNDDGSDAGTGSETDDGGGAFIEEPDGGVDNECDVWSQDCPQGEKCAPWANDGGSAWNALRCVPVDPSPKSPGDACTAEGNGLSGIDDCDVGVMCWNVDSETGMGVCVQLCGGTPNAPTCDDPSTSCSVAHDGILPLCLTDCDPILQDCPVENESCVVTADGGLRCEPNQAGTTGYHGDPCEYTNVCQPGLFCWIGEVIAGCNDPYCCTEFCDVTDPSSSQDCAATAPGSECIDWFENGPPPGLEHVGFCGLPS